MCSFSFLFFLLDWPTHLHEREGDGKWNILWGWPILMQIQHDNNFLPTSKHRQAKVSCFLGICFYECFIYFAQISSSENGLETRCHLRSGRKNSDSELREPIKTGEKMLFTDLVSCILKTLPPPPPSTNPSIDWSTGDIFYNYSKVCSLNCRN